MDSVMKRRGFLGMLAGAGLGVLAARTGLAQFALAIAEPELEPIEEDFDTANLRYRMTERYSNALPADSQLTKEQLDDVAKRISDPSGWFIVTGKDEYGRPIKDTIPRFYRAHPRLALSEITAFYGRSGQ